MGRKAKLIQSSEQIRGLIQSELRQRSRISTQYYKRLKVIDMALSGFMNKEISTTLNYAQKSVSLWRERWYEHQEELSELEEAYAGKRGSRQIFVQKIQTILSDNPRSGSPGHLTDAEYTRIQALACESPGKYGLPFTNWTHQTLSDVCKSMGMEVSRSQVGVILKKSITAA